MVDNALALTTFFWGIAAVASLSIALPQMGLLVRTSIHRDELWWFRLKTTLLFGSLGLAMFRNVAVWADYSFFDQYYLGAITERWPADLTFAFLIMVACLLAAALFWKTQRDERKEP